MYQFGGDGYRQNRTDGLPGFSGDLLEHILNEPHQKIQTPIFFFLILLLILLLIVIDIVLQSPTPISWVVDQITTTFLGKIGDSSGSLKTRIDSMKAKLEDDRIATSVGEV